MILQNQYSLILCFINTKFAKYWTVNKYCQIINCPCKKHSSIHMAYRNGLSQAIHQLSLSLSLNNDKIKVAPEKRRKKRKSFSHMHFFFRNVPLSPSLHTPPPSPPLPSRLPRIPLSHIPRNFQAHLSTPVSTAAPADRTE